MVDSLHRLGISAPPTPVVVEVVAATADTQVVWRCVGGPPEWVDTTMTFDLEQSGDEISNWG